MNRLMCLALTLWCSIALLAEISPVPGTQHVVPVFDLSDLVCSGFVSKTEVLDEQTIHPAPKKLLRRRMIATVEVRDSFKDKYMAGSGPIRVEYETESPVTRASIPSVQHSETAILFLTRKSDTYVFSDPFLGAIPFSVAPKALRGDGLAKLESALVGVLKDSTKDDRINAMRLLEGMPDVQPDTIASIALLAESPDPEVAFTAIAVLLHNKVPNSVDILEKYLGGYKGDAVPFAVANIGSELRQIQDGNALNALQALSGSRYLSIKFGAMDALRSMKDPRSASTWIQRMRDSNGTIQYIAIISLAETFGMPEAYAPSMQQFEQNPEKYKDIWQAWWDQRTKAKNVGPARG